MKNFIGLIAVVSLTACGGGLSKQDGAKTLASLNTSMTAAQSAVFTAYSTSAARDSSATSFSGSCTKTGKFSATLATNSGTQTTTGGTQTTKDAGYTFALTFTDGCTFTDGSAFDGTVTWSFTYGGTSSTDGSGSGSASGVITYGYIAPALFTYTDAKGGKHTLITDATGITVATEYDISVTGSTVGSVSVKTTVNGNATIDGSKLAYSNESYTVNY